MEGSVNKSGRDAGPQTERRLLFEEAEESPQSAMRYIDDSEK